MLGATYTKTARRAAVDRAIDCKSRSQSARAGATIINSRTAFVIATRKLIECGLMSGVAPSLVNHHVGGADTSVSPESSTGLHSSGVTKPATCLVKA